jgi:phage terminase large subunit-like protein
VVQASDHRDDRRVIAAKRESGADEIRVDGVGVGGGVVDQLTELGHGALDMQAGAAAQDRERFVNARSEWAWAMRERLEGGDIDLDVADEDLAAQLGSLKYRYNSRGQIVIESKDEMRKRGLPSPDHADAAILTAIAPAGADLFRRLCWRHWTLEGTRFATAGRSWAPSETWVFLTAHLPGSDDALGEHHVLSAWAYTLDGHLLLLDRARWKPGDATLADKVQPLVTRWTPDTMFVPRKQRTEQLMAEMARVVSINSLDVAPDAMSRILPAAAMQAAGKVWMPTAAWAEAAKSEFLAFPHSRQTGMVETLGHAVRVAATKWMPPPTPARPAKQPEVADPMWQPSTVNYTDMEL